MMHSVRFCLARLALAMACLWMLSVPAPAEVLRPADTGGVALEDISSAAKAGSSGTATPSAAPTDTPLPETPEDERFDLDEPDVSDDLLITLSVKPAQLVSPGDVSITFVIRNQSPYDVQNVTISNDDILGSGRTSESPQFSEPIGRIAVGETQTVVRTHSVTQEELDQGSIDYYITYDSQRPGSVTLGCTKPVEIVKANPMPSVDFTRQFSSAFVSPGGTLTVTYRLQNTGNVPVSDLRIQDPLGSFAARLEQLAVGESRSFISRVTLSEDAVSAPVLAYSATGGNRRVTLDEVPVRLLTGGLRADFTVSESPFNPGTADATLTLTNTGNAPCTGVAVTDAVYGGMIADAITVPADGEPVRVTFTYPIRGEDSQYRWLVTGRDGAGGALSLATDTVSLKRKAAEKLIAIELEATPRTPKISRAGNVTFDIRVANAGTLMAEDCLLYEVSRGDVRRLAVLPAEEAISIAQDYPVRASDQFIFCLNYTDADGRKRTVSTAPIDVEIAPGGVPPVDPNAPTAPPQGQSLKLGSTRTFSVLLAIATAALLVMITILVVVSLHARRDRRRRIAAERQRMKEEMGKTNPFTPIKQKQLRKKQKQALARRRRR